MQLSDFEYELPRELIAQYPPDHREAARLLRVSSAGNSHLVFSDVIELLAPGDLLVVNNTKVIKARMFARKDSGGTAEILVERLLDDDVALCQVKVSKPLKVGRALKVDGAELSCLGRDGQFYQLRASEPFLPLLERIGHIPLPPYIERPDNDEQDAQRYQTVYGKVPGAVAAPTAGLHVTDQILARLKHKGIDVAEVTLHVGAGTFQPVRGAIADHKMHSERYCISHEAAQSIRQTRAANGRIVALGTTVVRTLESAAIEGRGEIRPGARETNLFITPGFNFQVVDALITNFHLPGSTLLMLVSAFTGYKTVMTAYSEAIENRYRFFSYGDAMYLDRDDESQKESNANDGL